MKYHTDNELQNFQFAGAYIAEMCVVNGIFEMILDNVTILPQNSCNRDIREMRTNELKSVNQKWRHSLKRGTKFMMRMEI